MKRTAVRKKQYRSIRRYPNQPSVTFRYMGVLRFRALLFLVALTLLSTVSATTVAAVDQNAESRKDDQNAEPWEETVDYLPASMQGLDSQVLDMLKTGVLPPKAADGTYSVSKSAPKRDGYLDKRAVKAPSSNSGKIEMMLKNEESIEISIPGVSNG